MGKVLLVAVCCIVGIIAWAVISFRSSRYDDVALEHLRESYDFIIVGAGSAGCVLAARLTEQPDVNVLLLESGGHDDLFQVPIPLATVLLGSSKLNWHYVGESEPGQLMGRSKYGRQTHYVAGRELGGTSTINGMMYARGSPEDYDSWNRSAGGGWSFDEVLPYFKKSEHYEGPLPVDRAYHGYDGPLAVTITDPLTPALDAVLAAADEMGYGTSRDYNGERQFGFARIQSNIQNGRRWSEADAFLRPAWRRPNLHVMTGAHVSRVTMDGARAVGVEFFPPSSLATRRAAAGREVIVSAGAIGSPKILMLSGIGPRDQLAEHGIPVVADLQGVGENLQDHVIGFVHFLLNGHHGSTARDAESPRSLLSYLLLGAGPLATSGSDLTGFVRTKYAAADNATQPDVQFYIVCKGMDTDGSLTSSMTNMRVEFNDVFVRSTGARAKDYKDINVCSLMPNVLHAESRGVVWLQSANPFESPLIRPRYFSAKRDLKVLTEAVRIVFRLMSAPALRKRIELDGVDPLAMFKSMAQFVCPAPFSVDDDECMEKMVELTASTSYHYIGTCKMGAADDGSAVVDGKLLVRGLQGLRVVDASVMPTHISGNPNAAVVMIAEKASDLIKSQWHL